MGGKKTEKRNTETGNKQRADKVLHSVVKDPTAINRNGLLKVTQDSTIISECRPQHVQSALNVRNVKCVISDFYRKATVKQKQSLFMALYFPLGSLIFITVL